MYDKKYFVLIKNEIIASNMNIDNALYMLKELKVYSKQTNNVAHQHKAEVIALTSIEEVEAYDIIKDYPKN